MQLTCIIIKFMNHVHEKINELARNRLSICKVMFDGISDKKYKRENLKIDTISTHNFFIIKVTIN